MNVMRRVPPHDLEEDFGQGSAADKEIAAGKSAADKESAAKKIDEKAADLDNLPVAASSLAQGSSSSSSSSSALSSSTHPSSSSSSSKATYPVRARYPRKRFSLEDATFKPWRTPSPRKKFDPSNNQSKLRFS